MLTIPSIDDEFPLTQDVVFHLETPAGCPRARSDLGGVGLPRDRLEPARPHRVRRRWRSSKRSADEIIDTDVHYFGDYLPRGDGGQNIDILTYNVVDEFFFNPDAEQFTIGFFSSSFQDEFDRNIFFLDSLAWSFGLGSRRPALPTRSRERSRTSSST